MLVIHGMWAYGAAWLWAEDSALAPAAPPRPGRPSRAPRPHPFALDTPGLAAALAELPGPAGDLACRAVDDELTLRLPSGSDGPLASPELIRPPGQDGAPAGSQPGRRRVSLAAWRVPALAFEPDVAVDLLDALGEPGAFPVARRRAAPYATWPRWRGWRPTFRPAAGCCRAVRRGRRLRGALAPGAVRGRCRTGA